MVIAAVGVEDSPAAPPSSSSLAVTLAPRRLRRVGLVQQRERPRNPRPLLDGTAGPAAASAEHGFHVAGRACRASARFRSAWVGFGEHRFEVVDGDGEPRLAVMADLRVTTP
jgi:hypothetical protein